ncbi:2-hydroxyacid dehydrogenase [archaeon]
MELNKILLVGYTEETLEPKQWERLDGLAKGRVLLPKDSPEIPAHSADTDCLLVKLGATVDKDLMDSMPNLKYIGMLGTGCGRIDLAHAASNGITVSNLVGYSTESVAELVFALILEHIREIEKAKAQAREGNYSEDGFEPYEIKNKAFGVVGLGRIGARTAEIALNGFGADVRYWSRTRKEEQEKNGVKYQGLDALLGEVDFVSIHMEANKETNGFFGPELIQKIKPGAVVVNTAPMDLVDTSALANRLAKGDITFILDHSDELSEADAQELSKYKNCVMYPPIGYISKEATLAKLDMFVDNIQNFLEGKPTNVVQ